MPTLVLFLLILGLLIFAHELGHFVVAKLFRVRVEEFGFGYPPRMLKLGTWQGTVLSLNWLPLGGFVRMSEDDPTVEGGLASKSSVVRALVYVAGAGMNVVLAITLFAITFMIGSPAPTEGPGVGIYAVVPGSPAAAAGLRPGDNIVSLKGEPVQNVEQAVKTISANLGQPIELVVQRNQKLLAPVTVVPRVDPPANQGALGVSLGPPLQWRSYPVWEAVPRGVRASYVSVLSMFSYIRAAIRKQVPFEVSGPVGIYQATEQVAKAGLTQVLEFTAFLSINLFLVNLLPLPALDGGRLIFVLLEWVRGGRRVPPEKEGYVHFVGMALLIGLMVVVTYFDILRIFGN